VTSVHQFVPMLHVGDAVGQHTLAVQQILRSRGVESEIYVELDDAETAGSTRPASTYTDRPDDVLVYQFATASALADRLLTTSGRLVVNYHNVTPPELFAPWDNGLARHQVRAQQELADLAERAVLGVAVSEVNRADLTAAGFAATEVVPPIVGLLDTGRSIDGEPAGHRSNDGESAPVAQRAGGRRPREKGARWLAVGRLAPNKAVEDTVAALLAYRARHDTDATLRVIGKPTLPAYVDALHRYVADLGLADAVQFAGKVTDAALADAYDSADVLVVSSEHEGYCLPVVEAMAHGLPVVAYREGALPEVLGDAGVLLDDKDPVVVADAVRDVQVDAARRAALVDAGRRRLPELGLAGAGDRLVDLLVGVRG
jgi:glycosyltransferase involved in cell wall biosynthesis